MTPDERDAAPKPFLECGGLTPLSAMHSATAKRRQAGALQNAAHKGFSLRTHVLGYDVRLILVGLLLLAPLARAGYEEEYQAASDLWNTDKAAAINAFVELADKTEDPANAADCLRRASKLIWYYDRKDFDRSMALAQRIPIDSIAKATQMWVLNQHRKRDELLERFADAPVDTWTLDVRGEALRIRGNAWRERGEAQRAIADLRGAAQFIALDLWKAGSYLDLGDTWHELMDDDEKAIAAYRNAFEASRRLQTRIPAVRKVADLLTARGQTQAAVDELQTVDYDNAKRSRYALEYLRALGRTLAAAGQQREAVTAYRDALGVDGLSDAARNELQGNIEQLMLNSTDDLVLAARNGPPCQVVLPDAIETGLPDDTTAMLRDCAALMQTAFETNGFSLGIVTESTRVPHHPAIYLGATQFSRDHGIDIDKLEGWTYVHKIIDGNLLIAGNDQAEGPMPTLKGVTAFLHLYARVRFVDPTGVTGPVFLPTPVIAVPADLDHTVTPHVHVLSLPATENSEAALFAIANNYLTTAGTVRPGSLPVCDPWALAMIPGPAAYFDLGTAGGALSVAPQCAPLTAARLADECIAADVTDFFLDGFMNTPALSAPVWYLFGRIFDRADGIEAKDLLEEYTDAAFRETATSMRRFFDALYHPVQLYNSMPRQYTDVHGRRRTYLDGEPERWLALLYPAQVIAELEAHLNQAEEQSETPDVQARLSLVRIEFDRLRRRATRLHIEQAEQLSLQPHDKLR